MTPQTYWHQGADNRACHLCDHGQPDGQCKRAEVGVVTFDRARAKGGACGPEATYLTINGLDYSK